MHCPRLEDSTKNGLSSTAPFFDLLKMGQGHDRFFSSCWSKPETSSKISDDLFFGSTPDIRGKLATFFWAMTFFFGEHLRIVVSIVNWLVQTGWIAPLGLPCAQGCEVWTILPLLSWLMIIAFLLLSSYLHNLNCRNVCPAAYSQNLSHRLHKRPASETLWKATLPFIYLWTQITYLGCEPIVGLCRVPLHSK